MQDERGGPAPCGARVGRRSPVRAGSAPPPSLGSPPAGSSWSSERATRDRGESWGRDTRRTIPRSRAVPRTPRPRDRTCPTPRRSRPRDTPRPADHMRTSRTGRAPPCGPDTSPRRRSRAVRSRPCRRPPVARSARPPSPSTRLPPASSVGSRSTVSGSESPRRGGRTGPRGRSTRGPRGTDRTRGASQNSSMFEKAVHHQEVDRSVARRPGTRCGSRRRISRSGCRAPARAYPLAAPGPRQADEGIVGRLAPWPRSCG